MHFDEKYAFEFLLEFLNVIMIKSANQCRSIFFFISPGRKLNTLYFLDSILFWFVMG